MNMIMNTRAIRDGSAMRMTRASITLAAAGLISALAANTAHAQEYKADVPASITTPDTVETRIGTLKFFDGLPDAATAKKLYDHLDFYRGVETFMAGMPAASIQALKIGFTEAGFPPNKGVGVSEDLADAGALFLTPNTAVVYAWFCIDVKDEPIVVQAPPNVLAIVDDAYFRYVIDIGLAGADQGKGGKYLLVGPDHKGALPSEGYVAVQKTPTYNNLVIMRAFVQIRQLAMVAFAAPMMLTRAHAQDTTPDSVKTRIGDLKFEQGCPTEETMQKVFDEIDYQRAVQAFLWAYPAVSFQAIQMGLKRDLDVDLNEMMIADNFADPHGLWLTANDTTIYGMVNVDLGKSGPMVVEIPPGAIVGSRPTRTTSSG